MDCCRNVSVPGEYHQQEQVLSPPCSKLGALTTIDDLFPPQDTEVDVSLEWLSIFVEDCLSSTGNCLPAQAVPNTNVQNASTAPPKPSSKPLQNRPQHTPPSLQKFVVPGKARSKRKRATSTKTETLPHTLTSWTNHINPHNQLLHFTSSDPPLLQQAYWLADSELILPKKEDTNNNSNSNSSSSSSYNNNKAKENDVQEEEVEELEKSVMEGKDGGLGIVEGNSGQQPRRCTHCLAQRTPQWRAGPLGPKTLCNACGVRYKSGRLLPEYRPAKSPTFVSYLHSNSHKKVMEMRMALLPSVPK